MNIKLNKSIENSEFFNLLNKDLELIDFNTQGKIQEKLITINGNKFPFPKENKIKELEITLKPRKINRLISPKNEPYLKPKFKLKARNSFCIKNKNEKNKDKDITAFKSNNIIKDINLNMFKIKSFGNGKKIKITREINNKKEKIPKNKYLNNNIDNNPNNQKNKKIKGNNYLNELSNLKNSKTKKNKKNIIDMKYLYPDTPSQSTTTENKSDTKSKKTQTKNGTTNSKRQSNNKIKKAINEKCKLIKENIYYDNLPLFLRKKKQYKKISKTYKDMYNQNTKLNNGNINLLEKTIDSITKSGQNKDILIKRINFNNFDRETNDDFNEKQKKFISHKNNLSFSMAYDKENIQNNFGKGNNNSKVNKIKINNNIKKLYISSVKTRNIKDSKNYNLNQLDNIHSFNHSVKNEQENNNQSPDNYLFNFFRNRKKGLLTNNNYANNNQNLTNNNSYMASRESSFLERQNLSFNNNLLKNKTINFLNNNNENILNKTKNILKLSENQKFRTNKNSQKYLILDNYESNLERYPKRVIQQSHKNYREKIINIPNISYIINSTSMNAGKKKIILKNNFNKIRRPCSLYFNKNNIIRKDNKCNLSINDYNNNPIYKNNNLTINNININQNNLGNNKHIYKNFQTYNNDKEFDLDYNINKFVKLNINLKKFINNHLDNSSENIYKGLNIPKISDNNIFKFNRNKATIRHSHNTSLNIVPSLFYLNRTNNE